MAHFTAMLLSNALLVIPLVILVYGVTRWVRHPGAVWALWGLVLLKFVTPAVVLIPVDVSPALGVAVVDAVDVAAATRDSPMSQDSAASPLFTPEEASTFADVQSPLVDSAVEPAPHSVIDDEQFAISLEELSAVDSGDTATADAIDDVRPRVVPIDAEPSGADDEQMEAIAPSVVSMTTAETIGEDSTTSTSTSETAPVGAVVTSSVAGTSQPAPRDWPLILASA